MTEPSRKSPLESSAGEPGAYRSSPVGDAWRRLRKNRMAVVGMGIVFVLLLTAAIAPFISPHDPFRVDLAKSVAPPSRENPLGTDYLGRDVLSRIIYGARVSLEVGFLATLVAVLVGTLIGALAGFYGGRLDNVLMRITDIVFAFPTALFAIAVMAVFENPSVTVIFLVLGLIGWAGIARLVRGKVLSVREEEYSLAARALGASEPAILFRHILPNCMAPILVAATISVAGNILTEAWLSFLGLGAQPPTPSWGSMVTEGQSYLTTKPWVCVYPGLAIAVTVLGFNLFGDGLRDTLDPRLK